MLGFRSSRGWCSLALAACLALAGCGGGDDAPASTSPGAGSGAASAPSDGDVGNADAGSGSAPKESAAADPAALRKRGKVIYETQCTACHARNPAVDGPVGPALAGSSLALLEAKVIRNEYPPGYTPKRESAAMVALPHLEPEIPALHAFLNAGDD